MKTKLFYQVTLKALSFYTEFFDLEYPLPKLDLIALEDVEIGISRIFIQKNFKKVKIYL